MPDKWLGTFYLSFTQHADQWKPDLPDLHAIDIHQIDLHIRWPTATSDIQKYFDWCVIEGPAQFPVVASPMNWVEENADRLLAVMSPHLNMNYGEAMVMLAHEKYSWHFPVPRRLLMVSHFAYTPQSNGFYGCWTKINYERVKLPEDEYEQLLARSPWFINSRQPDTTGHEWE